jgi:uncharacterized protein
MKKITSKNLIDIVIYHHPCPDGFTCATIANLYFKDKNNKPEFIGMSHSQKSFTELEKKIKDKNVLICDFTFKKEMGLKILDLVKSIQIIDHHVCSQNDSYNIPNPSSYDLETYKSLPDNLGDIDDHRIFKINYCGATLTWEYFYPDIPVPLFVKYVEDNDIWIKAMINTYEVTAYINSLPYEFEEYEKLINDESIIHNHVIPVGIILWNQIQKNVDSAIQKSTVKMIELNNNIYFVALCNSNTNINEIGNKMILKYKHCDFSMIYNTFDKNTSVSFRSDETRANVNQIATILKGGGHRNASGASLYDKIIPGNIIGDHTNYKHLKNIEYIFDKKIKGDVFNYVTMNISHNKDYFAKYLLQTRTSEFFDENNIKKERNIQEACSCYRIKNNDNQIYKHFDFAVIWNYGDNKTTINLHWSCHKKYDIKDLFDNVDDLEINENKRTATFCLAGLKKDILNGE